MVTEKEKDQIVDESNTYDLAPEKFKKGMTKDEYKKMLKRQVNWESAAIVGDTMKKIVDNSKPEKREETKELLLSIVEEMSSEAHRIVGQLAEKIKL